MTQSSLLLTLCVVLAQLSFSFALYGHPISPGRIATNEKIKKNCSLIRISTTLEGHDDQQKTLDDVIEAVDQPEVVKDLRQRLVLVYNSSEAVKTGYVNEKKEEPHKVSNEFGRNLGAQGKFQLGELAKKEADDLYPVLFKLAVLYRDTSLAKEIHLIPIGKLRKSEPSDKQLFVVLVMHKHDQMLSANAALLLEVD